jgi:hypothetical protein
MFKKITLKTLVALAGVATLALPFILSDCSVAVYPKAKMEAAFKNVEKYLKENSTPTASGDVDFSSSTSASDYAAALTYFDSNFTIEHFYRSVIFYRFYLQLYPFSSTQRLDQYNKFYSQRDVTKVVEFSFGSTANSFEINLTLTYTQKISNVDYKCRSSTYCLVRLENQKLYEKFTSSMYFGDTQRYKDENDLEVTKKDTDKFFYIDHKSESTQQQNGIDVQFEQAYFSNEDSGSPYPELTSRFLEIDDIDYLDSITSGIYAFAFSPFD